MQITQMTLTIGKAALTLGRALFFHVFLFMLVAALLIALDYKRYDCGDNQSGCFNQYIAEATSSFSK